MAHEATVSKVSDDQLFYLMSRGLGEDEAMAMIVRGFVEPSLRAADGVRAGAQPAHRAADGRCGGLTLIAVPNVAAVETSDQVASHLHPAGSFRIDDHPVPTGLEEISGVSPR